MVDVWGLPEAQPMLPEIKHIAVLHALDRPGVVPLLKVDPPTNCAAGKHSLCGLSDEPAHSAAFVCLEVRDDDVAQARRVQT